MLKQVAHSARKRVRPEVFHPLFHGINHPGLHNQLFNHHEPISTRQAYGAEDNGMVSMSDGMSALIKLMKPACTNVREIAVDQWLLRLWGRMQCEKLRNPRTIARAAAGVYSKNGEAPNARVVQRFGWEHKCSSSLRSVNESPTTATEGVTPSRHIDFDSFQQCG